MKSTTPRAFGRSNARLTLSSSHGALGLLIVVMRDLPRAQPFAEWQGRPLNAGYRLDFFDVPPLDVTVKIMCRFPDVSDAAYQASTVLKVVPPVGK